tara:strand:- start:747 stop:1463 length:717 start_codon:yes stop_codon:yes gene_type:complete
MATPKPRARTVDDLKSNILNPSLTSTYETSFVFPGAVRNWIATQEVGNGLDYENLKKLTLSCREAALPGTSLATHTLDNDHTGVTERHAYRRQYDTTASFTFYVDVKYDSIFLFENWIKFIVNEDTNDENFVNSRSYNYRVNFPNEYKSEISIRKFEKDYNGKNLEYKFFNAYPIAINQMPVSYDASELLLCTVNFNFSRYIVKTDTIIRRPSTSDTLLSQNFLNDQGDISLPSQTIA